MRSHIEAIGLAFAALMLSATGTIASPRHYALPEETAAFRPGSGVEAAQDNCLSCHSADYVTTQPPRLGATFWEAEVSKMVKAYRAPIPDATAKAIVDYLSRTY